MKNIITENVIVKSELEKINNKMDVKKLNSNHLKLIAIIAMTIDHITDLLYPSFSMQTLPIIMHIIGRLTAPIMWFFIAEGYHYTKNVYKYMIRLGIFAVVSHFAYCFAFGLNYIPLKDGVFNQTSVMYPLFIAVLVLFIQDKKTSKKNKENTDKKTKLKEENTKIKNFMWQSMIFLLIFSAFSADWSSIAVLVIIAMYNNRNNLKKQMIEMMKYVSIYAIVAYFCVSKMYAIINMFAIIVYPVLNQYNGKLGKARWMKWLFYFYYPAHLIIIGIIRLLIYGNVNILF